eukprot:5655593-Ditylum_brightwellii.AAC.1
MTACAEKTATIEDTVDMPIVKRSKVFTLMNTISLCKTKENILETIANLLFLLNHNIAVEEAAPPLLHS